MLNDAQAQLCSGIESAASQMAKAGVPAQGAAFVQCLDPTLNQLLDGPDALLTGLQNGAQNPSAFQSVLTSAGSGLQNGIMSLAVNLPNALLALAGQKTCSAYTGPYTPSGSGSGLPTTGTPLDQLIALINQSKSGSGGLPSTGTPLDGIIQQLAALQGGSGSGSGPTGTPLDAILGPLQSLASGAGGSGSQQALLLTQLGAGLNQLGTAIAANNPNMPVATPLVQTLSSTVSDLGTTLQQISTAQTAGNLQRTVGDLLTNVNGLLTGPQGLLGTFASYASQSSAVASMNTQINGYIAQGVGALSALLNPLAGQNGVTTQLLSALSPLTCALMLTGNCSSSSNPLSQLSSLASSAGSSGSSSNPLSSLTSALPSGSSNPLSSLTSALPSGSSL